MGDFLSSMGLGGTNEYTYQGKLSDGSMGWNSDPAVFQPGSINNYKQTGTSGGLGSILGGDGDSGMLGGAMGTLGGLGSLYGMYQSFGMKQDYMDMMKEQMGMAREQWGITKDEINSINNTKARLNAQYNSQDTYTAPAKI